MTAPTSKPWPLRVLIPLAILGPPVLGIALTEGTPHSISSNGSAVGLLFFPFVSAALIAFAAWKAQPGGRRVGFSIVAGLCTALWTLIMFIGMIAP